MSVFNTTTVNGLQQEGLLLPTREELGARAFDTIRFWMEEGHSQLFSREQAIEIASWANKIANSWSVKAGDQVQSLVQLLPPAEIGTAHMELSMANTTINLEDGWKQHPGVIGGWHLEYVDPVAGFDISIVTGPPGSGLMGVIAPGKPTTYEAWLPGLSNPTGYLTLDEIRGVITYLREKYRDDTMYIDWSV